MTRKKWMLALIGVLLAAAIGVLIFCNLYIFPKTALLRALDGTVTRWLAYYDNSPISLVVGYLDPDGRYTAQLEATTENAVLGQITYSMEAQTDGAANQFFASGTASAGELNLALSIYMDGDFMALSSQELLGGAYYGITYDTFSADIRSIPLLSLVAGEERLAEWEASVANIQSRMLASYAMPEMPELTEADMDALLKAVLLLPGKIGKEEIAVGEQTRSCRCITYSASGEQAGKILQYFMDSGENPSISAAFYVYQGELVCFSLTGSAGESSAEYVLEFPDISTLTLHARRRESGEDSEFSLTVRVQESGAYHEESWAYFPDFQGTGEARTLSYRWDADAGEMMIEGKTPVYLSASEDGLTLATEDLGLLIDLLSGDAGEGEGSPISCTMTLTQGSSITRPEYKNVSDWSLNDLLVLLGGVGSLFGLSIG